MSSAAKGRWKLAALILLAGAVAVALLFLPVTDHLESFLQRVRDMGMWGPVALGAVYVVASVLFLPGSVLTMGSGFSFGLVVGTAVVVAASNLAASACFWIGRTIGREWIESKVRKNPRFRAIDEAVGEKGFRIVLLTRLSPVFPFNMLNYAYGLTRVRFSHYLLGSLIGMFPGTVMYVYLGTAVENVAQILSGDGRQKTPAEYVLLGVGLLATIVVTLTVSRLAGRAIREKVRLDDADDPPAEPVASATPSEGRSNG